MEVMSEAKADDFMKPDFYGLQSSLFTSSFQEEEILEELYKRLEKFKPTLAVLLEDGGNI